MYQKPCRLTLVDKYYGGGLSVGPSPGSRRVGQEFPQIQNIFRTDETALSHFFNSFGPLGQAGEIGSAENSAFNATINPTLQSGGALTPQETRSVEQGTSAAFAARGNAAGNQSMVADFQNRDAAKTNKFNTALSQAGGIQNSILAPFLSGIQAFTGVTDPLLSYAGNLFGENLQASQQTSLANQNKGGAIPSQAGSVLGSVLGGIASSDRRLKTNIKDTGEKTPEGIPIKTFEWKHHHGKGPRYMGVIAQDVHRHAPHAVHKGRDGVLRVNFSAIHAPFHQLGSKGGKGGPRSETGSTPQDGKDLSLAPLSAYTPGRGNRKLEGKRETSSGDPIHTFEDFLRGHSKYITGATRDKRDIGKTVIRHLGNRAVPVKITDFGPGVKGIDIASDNPKWAHSFPFQGAIERGIHTVTAPLRMAGRALHRTDHRGFPGMPLGRSGFPRATRVGRGVGIRSHERFGEGGGPRNEGQNTFAFGTPFGPGSGPGSPAGSPFNDNGGAPPGYGLTPGNSTQNPSQSPDISSQIPWDVPNSPYDFIDDYTGYEGQPIGANFGSGGGIQ